MTLGEKLKKLRDEAGITQQQLSDAINIKRTAYAYYEVEKCYPKIETLKSIAKLYNITIDELVDDNPIDKIAQDSDPEFETGFTTDDKFNDLSDFEKSVVMKVRLMSKKEKTDLVDYISNL